MSFPSRRNWQRTSACRCEVWPVRLDDAGLRDARIQQRPARRRLPRRMPLSRKSTRGPRLLSAGAQRRRNRNAPAESAQRSLDSMPGAAIIRNGSGSLIKHYKPRPKAIGASPSASAPFRGKGPDRVRLVLPVVPGFRDFFWAGSNRFNT